MGEKESENMKRKDMTQEKPGHAKATREMLMSESSRNRSRMGKETKVKEERP